MPPLSSPTGEPQDPVSTDSTQSETIFSFESSKPMATSATESPMDSTSEMTALKARLKAKPDARSGDVSPHPMTESPNKKKANSMRAARIAELEAELEAEKKKKKKKEDSMSNLQSLQAELLAAKKAEEAKAEEAKAEGPREERKEVEVDERIVSDSIPVLQLQAKVLAAKKAEEAKAKESVKNVRDLPTSSSTHELALLRAEIEKEAKKAAAKASSAQQLANLRVQIEEARNLVRVAEAEAEAAREKESANSPKPTSSSVQRLAALRTEVDEARKAAKAEAEHPQSNAAEIAALEARIAAEKARQEEESRRKAQAMRISSRSPKPMSDSARQIAYLQAQIEKKKREQAEAARVEAEKARVEAEKKAQPHMISHTAGQIAALRAQIAAKKAQEEESKPPPPKSENARQIEIVRAQLELMKNPPKSENARQIEALKEELAMQNKKLELMKNPPKPNTAREIELLREELALLRNPPNSDTARKIEALKEELAMLKKTDSDREIADLQAQYDALSKVGGGIAPLPSQEKTNEQVIEALQAQLRMLEMQAGSESLKRLEEEKKKALKEAKEEEELKEEEERLIEEDPEIKKKKEELRKLQEDIEKGDTKTKEMEEELKVEENEGKIKEAEEKKEELKEAVKERKHKASRGIDLCLVLDATKSMQWIITECQKALLQVFDHARKIAKGGVVRVAFVVYRDFGLEHQYQVVNFMEGKDLEKLREFIGGVEASSKLINPDDDLDIPEDVAGALRRVSELDWKSNIKLIFHAADAPGHGEQYHKNLYDLYPRGDPEGSVLEDLVKGFAKERIDYYFLRMKEITDIMCDKFKEAYEEVGKFGGKFEVVKGAKGEGGVNKFLEAVVWSLTRSSEGY